jgi:hypothetical protein
VLKLAVSLGNVQTAAAAGLMPRIGAELEAECSPLTRPFTVGC